jgi:hypothetical protein
LSDFLLEAAEASLAFFAEVGVFAFLLLVVGDLVVFLLGVEVAAGRGLAGDFLLLDLGVVAVLDELRVQRTSPSLSLSGPLESESASLCCSSFLASGVVRWLRGGVT